MTVCHCLSFTYSFPATDTSIGRVTITKFFFLFDKSPSRILNANSCNVNTIKFQNPNDSKDRKLLPNSNDFALVLDTKSICYVSKKKLKSDSKF